MVISRTRLMGLLKMKSSKMFMGVALAAAVLTSVSTASAAVLLEWNMNEGAGSTVGDSSSNGRNGTWNADLVGAGSWVTGRTGLAGDTAVRFTQPVGPAPRIDWVDAGNAMPLTQNGNFEVEMWLNADGFANSEVFFTLGRTAGTTMALRVSKNLVGNQASISELLLTTIDNSTGFFADNDIDITGNSLNAGTWQQIRVVYNETSPFVDSGTPGSSTMDFYVGPNLANTLNLGYALADLTDEAHIGNLPGGIWYTTFRGAVDDFKVSSNAPIPEPASLVLALFGVVGLAAMGRRRKDI